MTGGAGEDAKPLERIRYLRFSRSLRLTVQTFLRDDPKGHENIEERDQSHKRRVHDVALFPPIQLEPSLQHDLAVRRNRAPERQCRIQDIEQPNNLLP